MAYSFDFSAVFDYSDVLLQGILMTVQLTAVGTVFGVGLGIVGAAVMTSRSRILRVIVSAYVELIRNTPFLVQLFFIFFGLPALGFRLSAWEAASLAMVINLGAYSTEIIRAGIEATPKGQIEAGLSLGMNRVQVFRHIIISPAMQRIWPALSSQIVIVMLGSAVCSQIAAEELTYAANFIQSRNFRAFESYFVTTILYLALAIALRFVLKMVGNHMFKRRSHA
ncbi:amino acid ABC transporter permease [Telmatospirillum sp. J64-1]|uniref:amino acid ABC transporter permease n=1 Tax=Telmatospirillum sp. J64-1 TaxID=2502183 RepID=UPI00115F0BE6|nr:amino acid ABC transporter permease [Telmatospirillum sp. J64-1]